MNFGTGGGGIGVGGIVVLMMLGTLLISVVRYNFFTRPQEERDLADAHEAEERQHRAEHEFDVPTAEEDRI